MRTVDRHVAVASGLRSVPNPKKTAKALQRMGTHGDDILAHINAKEAALLDMLADGRLDGGGVNKRTGLKSFGNTDGESGRSGGDANPGGVGGGPTGGQTGGGLGGHTSEGQGGLTGGYGGAELGDRGAPSSGENVGGNPEMGGGINRSIGLRSVEALGLPGSPMRNVNAASAVMAGRTPSFSDKVNDFVGTGAPGGFPGSRAANLGATIAGGLIAGPWGAAAANVAHNAVLGGRSLTDTVPGVAGGMIAGGLGSMAAQTVADAIRGKESYEPTMSQADRDAKDKAGIENARNGGAPAQSEPGSHDGAGAGTAYVMAAPETAAPAPTTASAPTSSVKDNWNEAGFLTRNPEVAKAVKDGIWTSGRSFNTAYKAQAGSNYDSAKALGALSPYTNDMLAARPGVAVAYRG